LEKLINLYRVIRVFIYDERHEPHHEPHVHVRLKDGREGNIAIRTGRVLNGDLGSKEIRIVRAFLVNNEALVLAKWHQMQEGKGIEPLPDLE